MLLFTFFLWILLNVLFIFLTLVVNVNIIFVVFTLNLFYLILCLYYIIKLKKKALSIISLILCFIFIIPSCLLIFNFDKKNSEYVIHAGGSLDNINYLNCFEGLNY